MDLEFVVSSHYGCIQPWNKNMCDALRDLASFVQFKKRVKHPWTSLTFSKVADLSVQLYLK